MNAPDHRKLKAANRRILKKFVVKVVETLTPSDSLTFIAASPSNVRMVMDAAEEFDTRFSLRCSTPDIQDGDQGRRLELNSMATKVQADENHHMHGFFTPLNICAHDVETCDCHSRNRPLYPGGRNIAILVHVLYYLAPAELCKLANQFTEVYSLQHDFKNFAPGDVTLLPTTSTAKVQASVVINFNAPSEHVHGRLNLSARNRDGTMKGHQVTFHASGNAKAYVHDLPQAKFRDFNERVRPLGKEYVTNQYALSMYQIVEPGQTTTFCSNDVDEAESVEEEAQRLVEHLAADATTRDANSASFRYRLASSSSDFDPVAIQRAAKYLQEGNHLDTQVVLQGVNPVDRLIYKARFVVETQLKQQLHSNSIAGRGIPPTHFSLAFFVSWFTAYLVAVVVCDLARLAVASYSLATERPLRALTAVLGALKGTILILLGLLYATARSRPGGMKALVLGGVVLICVCNGGTLAEQQFVLKPGIQRVSGEKYRVVDCAGLHGTVAGTQFSPKSSHPDLTPCVHLKCKHNMRAGFEGRLGKENPPYTEAEWFAFKRAVNTALPLSPNPLSFGNETEVKESWVSAATDHAKAILLKASDRAPPSVHRWCAAAAAGGEDAWVYATKVAKKARKYAEHLANGAKFKDEHLVDPVTEEVMTDFFLKTDIKLTDPFGKEFHAPRGIVSPPLHNASQTSPTSRAIGKALHAAIGPEQLAPIMYGGSATQESAGAWFSHHIARFPPSRTLTDKWEVPHLYNAALFYNQNGRYAEDSHWTMIAAAMALDKDAEHYASGGSIIRNVFPKVCEHIECSSEAYNYTDQSVTWSAVVIHPDYSAPILSRPKLHDSKAEVEEPPHVAEMIRTGAAVTDLLALVLDGSKFESCTRQCQNELLTRYYTDGIPMGRFYKDKYYRDVTSLSPCTVRMTNGAKYSGLRGTTLSGVSSTSILNFGNLVGKTIAIVSAALEENHDVLFLNVPDTEIFGFLVRVSITTMQQLDTSPKGAGGLNRNPWDYHPIRFAANGDDGVLLAGPFIVCTTFDYMAANENVRQGHLWKPQIRVATDLDWCSKYLMPTVIVDEAGVERDSHRLVPKVGRILARTFSTLKVLKGIKRVYHTYSVYTGLAKQFAGYPYFYTFFRQVAVAASDHIKMHKNGTLETYFKWKKKNNDFNPYKLQTGDFKDVRDSPAAAEWFAHKYSLTPSDLLDLEEGLSQALTDIVGTFGTKLPIFKDWEEYTDVFSTFLAEDN